MNEVNDKITEKIAQLLAMAEHPNSNQNEAAVALEKAQALLLRHNLERADILNTQQQTPDGIGKLGVTELNGYTWKINLAAVLAKSNLCRVIGSPSSKSWHIFGSYDNVRAVVGMYDWITTQLVWMCEKEFRDYKNDEGTERGQTWKAGYFMGAIAAIKGRLAPPMEEFKYGTGHDLVIINDAALSTAVKQVYPRLTSRRVGGNGGRDGQSTGKAAGGNMNLTPTKQLGTLRLGAGV